MRADAFPTAYDGDDYPPEWPIHQEIVGLYPEDTHRYALDTSLGSAEWRTMLPAGDGFIHLGPHDRRFGVTMFHQLQCLDVIRQALTDTQGGDANELIHHCMNYLRQMALCHSHTALESVRADKPPKIVDLTRSMYECRDWTALYKGAEANHLRRESVDSFGGSRQLTYRCNPEKSRGKQE